MLNSDLNRIWGIDLLEIPSPVFEIITAAMQRPFPGLTRLHLRPDNDEYDRTPALTDAFLAGSAPRLRGLWLENITIPFLALQKLCLSANNLFSLRLWRFPESMYISPETMATFLSSLPRLKEFSFGLEIQISFSRPERPSQIPPTRSVLPTLTSLNLECNYEYLEDLLDRIDAPLLRHLYIDIFENIRVKFDVQKLSRFIGHSTQLNKLHHAMVEFCRRGIVLAPAHQTGVVGDHPQLVLRVHCWAPNRLLLPMAKICHSLSPLFSPLEHLLIGDQLLNPQLAHWTECMDRTLWLELLKSFTSVKNLYLTPRIALLVGRALRSLAGERVMEVLPTLECLFLGGLERLIALRELFRSFVSARQLSGRPVAIRPWVRI
jgi:hypothetical protein